jgi:hypothetical protein
MILLDTIELFSVYIPGAAAGAMELFKSLIFYVENHSIKLEIATVLCLPAMHFFILKGGRVHILSF